MTDIESIVIEIRRDGEIAERIKFLPDAHFLAGGIRLPLTDSDDVLYVTREDKISQ